MLGFLLEVSCSLLFCMCMSAVQHYSHCALHCWQFCTAYTFMFNSVITRTTICTKHWAQTNGQRYLTLERCWVVVICWGFFFSISFNRNNRFILFLILFLFLLPCYSDFPNWSLSLSFSFLFLPLSLFFFLSLFLFLISLSFSFSLFLCIIL